MVAKLIAWGETREEAIEVMRRALKVCQLDGLKTNARLHEAIMNDAEFQRGGVDTAYLAGLLSTVAEGEKGG
jgi:acetyl-CoA carboxylase, biotin carboxylase subunit